MIGAVYGDVYQCDIYSALIMTPSGVAYEINVSNLSFTPSHDHPLWIHSHYPEKGPPSMWGFREKDERDCFRRLLKIDGVGPKVAMRIVGNKAVISWRDKMDSGKEFNRLTVAPAALLAVRGVGATLAKRIQEELSK